MVTQVASSSSALQHSAGLRAAVTVGGNNDVQRPRLDAPEADRVNRTQTIEREQSRLSLNLKTQDGDRIQVRFGESDVSKLSVRSSDGDVRVRQVERHSERLSIRIEGELDADEREALESVVAAAFDLAEDFFAGEETDVAGLLNAFALEGDEISKLSLKLTQKSESIQKFSSSGEDGRFEGRSVERAVERLQARFESLGNGLRVLLTEASESPVPQPAIQLARVSVSAALDAVLVSESETSARPAAEPGQSLAAAPPAEADPAPASQSLPAAPADTAPAPADEEQPGAVNVQTLAPGPEQAPQPAPAPSEPADVAAPAPQPPAVDQVPVDDGANPADARPTTDDSSAAPPASAPRQSALEELRGQLIAALELANERGSIEVFAKHVERSETTFRLRVAV